MIEQATLSHTHTHTTHTHSQHNTTHTQPSLTTTHTLTHTYNTAHTHTHALTHTQYNTHTHTPGVSKDAMSPRCKKRAVKMLDCRYSKIPFVESYDDWMRCVTCCTSSHRDEDA